MQAYLIRHATLRKKMSEVGVDVPDLLAGWHLMTRSGTPKGTHLQIRSLCGGNLSYKKVAQALLKMFDGDHKPNVRDLHRTTPESAYQVEDDEDVFYEEPANLYYEDEVYYDHHEPYTGDFEEDSVYYEDELVPEELDAANEEVEDAYMSYVDSRRRMKEIALARGFFPVMAVPPSELGHSGSWGGGKALAKGRARARAKEKEKGKAATKAAEVAASLSAVIPPDSEGIAPRTWGHRAPTARSPRPPDLRRPMVLDSSGTGSRTQGPSLPRTSPWLKTLPRSMRS